MKNFFKKKKLAFIFAFLIAITLGTAIFCSIYFTNNPKIKRDTSIEILCADTITINEYEEFILELTCSESDAEITLESNNTNIAIIEGTTIIGNSIGQTTILVTAKKGNLFNSKTILITIRENITNLGINLNSEIDLFILKDNILKARNDGFMDSIEFSCNYPFYYEIEDENIINIDSGKITAKSYGETTLTFFLTENPEINSTHKIYVKKIPSTLQVNCNNTITLDIEKEKENFEKTFTIELLPIYHTDKPSIQCILDNNIVKINKTSTEITITALQKGSTLLKIYQDSNLIKTISIVVNEDPKPEITDLSISLEKEITIYPITTDITKAKQDNFYNKVSFTCPYEIEYEIEDERKVLISGNEIIARSVGETIITFYLKENHDIKSIHTIYVKDIVSKITLLSDENITLDLNKDLNLDKINIDYDFQPSYATKKPITRFEIEDDSIISILKEKQLVAKKVGSTTLKIFENEVIKYTINVTVCDSSEPPPQPAPTYSLKIESSNATIVDHDIFVTGNPLVLQISLIASDNSDTSAINLTVSPSTNLIMGNHVFNFTTDGDITIKNDDIGLNEVYHVILQ